MGISGYKKESQKETEKKTNHTIFPSSPPPSPNRDNVASGASFLFRQRWFEGRREKKARMTFSLSLSRVSVCEKKKPRYKNAPFYTRSGTNRRGARISSSRSKDGGRERERERERKPAEGNFSNASEPEVGNGLSSFPMEEVIPGFRGLA